MSGLEVIIVEFINGIFTLFQTILKQIVELKPIKNCVGVFVYRIVEGMRGLMLNGCATLRYVVHNFNVERARSIQGFTTFFSFG